MPELPEVHTTVEHLKRHLPNLVIEDVWSRYDSSFYDGKNNIKNKKYFKTFRKEVSGKTVDNVDRRGKYIIILDSVQKRLEFQPKGTAKIMIRQLTKNIF